jgi:type VI secretion system protein ImpA
MGLKKALEECFDLVNGIVKKKRELEPDPVAVDSIDAAASTTEAANGTGAVTSSIPRADYSGGGLPLEPVDRADALQRLEAIAGYFLRTEPHSPVSYLIQRAVRWGQMPLEQWLMDVVGDAAVLAHIRETLGIIAAQKGES